MYSFAYNYEMAKRGMLKFEPNMGKDRANERTIYFVLLLTSIINKNTT